MDEYLYMGQMDQDGYYSEKCNFLSQFRIVISPTKIQARLKVKQKWGHFFL